MHLRRWKVCSQGYFNRCCKGFCVSIGDHEGNGKWLDVRHLLCRWHIYEAIKRHCARYFKRYEQGTQRAELSRLITAFKNVVCAPNEGQMKGIWDSAMEKGGFPEAAVQWIKKEYYNSPKARQIMECYVFNCGNLHQTTTSRNEGMHAAYRSKSNVIPKPAESYLLRRKHKNEWLQRLRSAAVNAHNRIPLDIQNVPELHELVGKLSLFSLNEIRRQILLTRREVMEGRVSTLEGMCECHVYRRYGLPCRHMIPTDGSAIPLDSIARFWRLDNWNQAGYCFDTCI
jgi:hypothetical protein